MIILDTPTQRVLPKRPGDVKALIIHTTGETDLDKILAFYTSRDGFQPHYMIATTGAVRRIADERLIAYHCKIDEAEAKLYALGYFEWSRWKWESGKPAHLGHEFPGYFEWRDTWTTRGKHSPLDLITGHRPNANSVGIELQQPTDPTPDIFTDEQYRSLAELLAEVGKRHQVVLDRFHVLGHYDVSPMRRCTAKGNWDPGFRFRWNRLWDMLRKRSPIT